MLRFVILYLLKLCCTQRLGVGGFHKNANDLSVGISDSQRAAGPHNKCAGTTRVRNCQLETRRVSHRTLRLTWIGSQTGEVRFGSQSPYTNTSIRPLHLQTFPSDSFMTRQPLFITNFMCRTLTVLRRLRDESAVNCQSRRHGSTPGQRGSVDPILPLYRSYFCFQH